MAVPPKGLDGVTANHREPEQLERLRSKRLLRPFVKSAHDIPLSLAAGAGTISPQRFELDETLRAIIPFDGQFIPNVLNINRSHVLSRLAIAWIGALCEKIRVLTSSS